MEKYSEVVGLPVINIDNGKKLGNIGDVMFIPGKKEVLGFILDKRGYELGNRCILLEDVVNLGNDALIVNSSSCISKVKKVKNKYGIKKHGEVRGLRIYTKSGEDLGIVRDVLFDYKTGVIEGFEISDGILQDILQGRNILPLFGKVEFSEESVIVEREAIDEMTATGGGIKNIIKKIDN